MAYDDFKEGCSVIKEYVDDQNEETTGRIPTKVSELTNDSNYATESYVNTAIENIAQPSSLPQTYKKKAVTLATSGWSGVGATVYDYTYTDADVKVNSEVRFTLDEANGKLAGQFGVKKTIDKEAGELTFTADTLPISAISGTLEIGDTSTEGAAFVDGIASETDTTGFVKATEENTFTETQTFNGTESQAGIKTNAIDNEDGNRVVYFNGTAQMFGSGDIPTQVRTSEQRLKLERPVSGGIGTEIVEIANLSDVSGGGAIKGKRFTFTEENIGKLGNDVNFSMTTSQNYAIGSTSSYTLVSADNRGMLQFEVGTPYKLEYQVFGETRTTVYAVASSMTLSDGTTVAKAEFAVNGKTLVVVDRATASADITSTSSLTYSPNGAVAYFSDFSTVAEYLPIHVFTIPKEYYVRIPFDETILSTDIVAIFTDKIAPTRVWHTSSYIELNYGVSSSVYYFDSMTGDFIRDFAEFLIGTDYYLAVVGSSTTGGAYVVSAKQENINDRSTTILVNEWESEPGGTFKWTDTGSASSSLIEYGVVWNSEVKLSFITDTDKETFEAAGCKVVSGKAFATPLTITCTTKPTNPICFTYTVRNNAR